jgi:hypothetical protein
MYLERLTRFDPRLLAVITPTEERALREARLAEQEIVKGRYRGPLHGMPYGAKDLLDTQGIRTTWGIKYHEARVPAEDATVIARLGAAGAVLVAKLSMGELARGVRWYGGTTRCPWDATRSSSGSSAGRAAAAAAGLVGFCGRHRDERLLDRPFVDLRHHVPPADVWPCQPRRCDGGPSTRSDLWPAAWKTVRSYSTRSGGRIREIRRPSMCTTGTLVRPWARCALGWSSRNSRR